MLIFKLKQQFLIPFASQFKLNSNSAVNWKKHSQLNSEWSTSLVCSTGNSGIFYNDRCFIGPCWNLGPYSGSLDWGYVSSSEKLRLARWPRTFKTICSVGFNSDYHYKFFSAPPAHLFINSDPTDRSVRLATES